MINDDAIIIIALCLIMIFCGIEHKCDAAKMGAQDVSSYEDLIHLE